MFNDDDYNEINELVDDYEKSLANGIDPFLDVDDTIEIAQYYDDRGETDKARHVLEHGLELHPAEPEIISFLVRINVVAYNNVEKAEQYAQMMRHDEHNIDYVLAHTDILIAKGRFEEANDMVDATVAYFNIEQKTDLFIEIAQMYVFAGEYEEALKQLKKCPIKSTRDFLELYGEVVMQLEQYSDGEAVYNKLLDSDAFCMDYWNNLAIAQMSQYKVDEAKESVAYALAIDSSDFQARMNQAHILFFSGQTKQARKLMDVLVDDYSKVPADKCDSDFLYPLLTNYAKVLIADNDPLTAIDYLTCLRDNETIFNSHRYEITRQLVVNYITLEKYSDALKTIQLSQNCTDLEDGWSYKVLEGCVHLCNDDSQKAAQSFLKAMNMSDKIKDTIYEIAVAYHDCGYYHDSIDMFTTLIDECNGDSGFGYIANCHKHLGKKKEYLDALKTACEVCPQEVAMVFHKDIPLGVQPTDYYNYVISHDDKSNERSRKKNDQ